MASSNSYQHDLLVYKIGGVVEDHPSRVMQAAGSLPGRVILNNLKICRYGFPSLVPNTVWFALRVIRCCQDKWTSSTDIM